MQSTSLSTDGVKIRATKLTAASTLKQAVAEKLGRVERRALECWCRVEHYNCSVNWDRAAEQGGGGGGTGGMCLPRPPPNILKL